MEESCDDDDVARYIKKESFGVFVVPVVVKRERERVAQPLATIRWIRSVLICC